jgi:hypothetical protein
MLKSGDHALYKLWIVSEYYLRFIKNVFYPQFTHNDIHCLFNLRATPAVTGYIPLPALDLSF